MTHADPREALRFDPTQGTVIRNPPGSGYGYWAGGHKVSYDDQSGQFALFYRERRPLGMGRGGRCAVAMSTDGIAFDDVWETDRESLEANSIEVGHCLRHDDGEWRLYLSYERTASSVWQIDVLRADDPSRFVAQTRRSIANAGHFGLSHLKDPWIIRRPDGGYDLYAATASGQPPRRDGNVLRQRPEDATVLLESEDGLYFPTVEFVFEASGVDTWDGHRSRLDSLFPWGGRLVGTFSGGRTMYDQFEEWCGLAISDDGRRIERLDTGGPWVRSPYGCVRYVYGLPVGDRIHFYYEYTREDGAHDLRVSVVSAG
jgi:hypothetical protein